MQGNHWTDPPIILAPSHEDRSKTIHLGVSDDLTGCRSANFRHTPLFMVWAHLCGQLPPINAIGLLGESEPTPTLSTLADATACFQGIERPHLNERDGSNVLIYVLQPKVTIEFVSAMACMARAVRPAVPFLLTVQVVLADALHYAVNGVDGLVTRLEPVGCDDNHGELPIEYETRYRRRCW